MPTTSQPRRVQKITQTTFAFPSMTLYSMLAGIRPIKSIHIVGCTKVYVKPLKTRWEVNKMYQGAETVSFTAGNSNSYFIRNSSYFFSKKLLQNIYIYLLAFPFLLICCFVAILYQSLFFLHSREQIQCFRDIFFNHTAYTARIDILFQQFNNLTATCMRTYCTI